MADPRPLSSDTITLTNLQLPHGIIAPDVWGKPKEQPALITLSLLLQGSGFGSAAQGDKLDDSTIHYGNLAKKIRAGCVEGQSAGDLSAVVEKSILEMGMKSAGRFIVARASVEVVLPKASMFGDGGVTLGTTTSYDETGRVLGVGRVFGVKGIKVMTLIGVNGYERSQKQPLVVSVLLHLRSEVRETGSGETVALFNLEQMVVQIIQDTSFETLETLADFTVVQLRKKMLDSVLPGTRVQLRIEKPRAIAWADAPAVEVLRDVPSKRSSNAASIALGKAKEGSRPATATSSRDVTGTRDRLSIIKPYSG
ncbi:hypothetical protein PRZ48_005407 [Zasmidium cellare]|uniref:dihydroneopterin aldolase n=1 Tax=Zasmidium cellare TaxID=395010 RepID=A0ABR0ETG8_ZASCE|nr:hypothetical protein PRZ48_005407 [Zasmidium cellare]